MAPRGPAQTSSGIDPVPELSPTRVAADLDHDGVPTARGGKWRASTVAGVLGATGDTSAAAARGRIGPDTRNPGWEWTPTGVLKTLPVPVGRDHLFPPCGEKVAVREAEAQSGLFSGGEWHLGRRAAGTDLHGSRRQKPARANGYRRLPI
jgi:hypothetical protein